jgi:peptidoglycan-N-acetylglucosamine deacetylase
MTSGVGNAPAFDQITSKAARRDIAEGRERLQQFFAQSVLGFAYPFGLYSEAVMQLVREAGHVYARTAQSVDYAFPPGNAFAFHPYCHFPAPDLWSHYEIANKCGVFYFWGHSYEMVTEAKRSTFENDRTNQRRSRI